MHREHTEPILASCVPLLPLDDPESCDHLPRLTGHQLRGLVHHQPEVLAEGVLERGGDGSVA